ncbi:GNAT family N-acetyltransferase [Mobilicoccus pelagius]|uniref:GNAT family N-acetyltransferase n=1 Tax=Mobilicoccus pelagius TaxID=746032 RepID=UPI00068F6C74|nr:GNAT family N-acetyltransferase [Mobilicoccus pelagius]
MTIVGATYEYTGLRPTDIAELARIHERGFPAFFLTSLGLPFLREFYRGHLDDPSAVAVVARLASGPQRGRPVGVVVGTTRPAGFYSRLLRRHGVAFALAGARGALRHPTAVPRLVRALTYRGDAPAPSFALLSSIVVDPAHGGSGIGAELQERWCHRAAAMGARRAYLQTDADENIAVRAFYRRCGWVETQVSTTPEGRRLMRNERDLTALAPGDDTHPTDPRSTR